MLINGMGGGGLGRMGGPLGKEIGGLCVYVVGV